MSGGRQFSMHLPTGDLARRAMLNVSASVAAAVEQTRGGCTAAAEAFPAWSTSSVLRSLHAVQTAAITGHVNDLGSHASRLGTSVETVREADRVLSETIATALNHPRA